MEQEPRDKRLGRSAAIALLIAGLGAGVGWGTWLASGNNAVAIGVAGPVALLASNFFRTVLK